MIDPTRRTLLDLVEQLSEACPDYRFGQMILNLAFLAREEGDQRLWDMEDAELVAAARKHLDDWRAGHDEGKEVARPIPTPASA